jgi:exopolysaccharide production protein ExoZ
MIVSIQYIRFLAATLVVLAHANLQIYGFPARVTNLGGFGVDLFFVISGYIMLHIIYQGQPPTSLAEPKIGALEFLLRRVQRILPMYIFITLIYILLAYLVHKLKHPLTTADLAYFFNIGKVDLVYFLESVTFTHFERPPIAGVGWSLQYEFVFYIYISIALFLTENTKKHFALVLSCIVFSIFVISRLDIPSTIPVIKIISYPLIFEFFLGMQTYKLVSTGVKLNEKLSLILLPASLATYFYMSLNVNVKIDGDLYRPLIAGSCAFIFVYAAVSLESKIKRNDFLLFLGDSSYSLYLTHTLIAPFLVFAWVIFELNKQIHVVVFICFVLIACQAIAIVTYKYMEAPLNKFLRAKNKRLNNQTH